MLVPVGESNAAVAQIELADGQIDNGLKAVLSLFLGTFGVRNIGLAVGGHDDVGLGLFRQQVGDIDEAAEGREQFQIDLQQIGAEQRRAPAGSRPWSTKLRTLARRWVQSKLKEPTRRARRCPLPRWR